MLECIHKHMQYLIYHVLLFYVFLFFIIFPLNPLQQNMTQIQENQNTSIDYVKFKKRINNYLRHRKTLLILAMLVSAKHIRFHSSNHKHFSNFQQEINPISAFHQRSYISRKQNLFYSFYQYRINHKIKVL